MTHLTNGLAAQQRRTRNIARRWRAGYVEDALMVEAERALAVAYADAATWGVESYALANRYRRLADRHALAARTLATAL